MITIYALLENAQIRYIGKTKKADLQEKLDQHIKEAGEKPGQFGWITKMIKQGIKPEIKPVFTFSEEESPYYEELFLQDFRHLVYLKPNTQTV